MARYVGGMQIRAMTATDLANLNEIDGTFESAEYLHVERTGEGLAVSWKIEARPVRQKTVDRKVLNDENILSLKQIVNEIDDGIALVADYDGIAVGAVAARFEVDLGILRVIDLRVDYDYRRQGLGSGLMFEVIQAAKGRELRAVAAEAPANNFPIQQLLAKLGFELAGLDTHRVSNHDLVKESVSLFWYQTLN